ncbi:hypothetical protein GH714_019797 [Hevea brasiliensis]|uniref:Uncharacterized protein n=1 Tax=Hevea brasiliensis TaxID=3981 RepID=A0A6A6LTY8_HEVBR|nr:hypothetical protein GH714_019797 [Hevea brasiliensis]
MAYYSSSYYMDDHGEYDGDYPLTHSYSSYDSAAVQDSMAYSSYKSNDYQIFAYDPIPLFVAYDPVSSYSRTAYSVCTSSEPKYIQYDPDLYFPAQTQFIISYSVSESGEPDFEEYDPTPYGGGYDLTQTYGKPLPPSDETCYPRSTTDLGTFPLNGVSSVPITSPIGEKEVEQHAKTPPSESQPQPPAINETEQQQLREYDHDHGNSQREPLDLYPGEQGKSQGLPGGLFPDNVISFDLDQNGRLEVHLDGPCMAKYETRVHFDSVVRANLSYGGLGLEGISQEELFLWFPVKGIIVSDPSSGLILFDIGLAHKQLSRSLFEDPPVCKPQGALLENFGRKMGFAVLR